MRTAFISTLCDIVEERNNFFLLTGDLGYSVIEPFNKRYPDKYVNVGVAEQNMMGIATGLSLKGNIVYTYSIVNFTILRCLEQIRNDICYHKANVKIVGVGGGYTYGSSGMTHHGIEDLAIMSTLPNMTVLSPCDPVETRQATLAASRHEGPCYIRLRKSGEPIIHPNPPDFKIGRGITVREGRDATIIGTGWILNNALRAAILLKNEDIDVRVISMHTIKPLDEEIILKAADETSAIITLEEGSSNALGGTVALSLIKNYKHIKFASLGINGMPSNYIGSQEYLLEKAGLVENNIKYMVKKLLNDI